MPWKRAPSCATGPLVSFNSRLGLPLRQTRLEESLSTRILLPIQKDAIRSPMLTSQKILGRSIYFISVAMVALPALTACAQNTAASPSGTQPPVAYASVNELNGILTELQ